MSSLIRRIEKMEARLLPAPVQYSEEDIHLCSAYNALFRQLTGEQRAIIDSVGQDLVRRGFTRSESRNVPPQYDSAFTGFVVCVEGHVKDNRPLALPDVVWSVYLENADAKPEVECADCGYLLPCGGWGKENVFFETCPLCDGKVGRNLFKRH